MSQQSSYRDYLALKAELTDLKGRVAAQQRQALAEIEAAKKTLILANEKIAELEYQLTRARELQAGAEAQANEFLQAKERAYAENVEFIQRLCYGRICEDCNGKTKLTVRDDHHGGYKIVCEDRDACHQRRPN